MLFAIPFFIIHLSPASYSELAPFTNVSPYIQRYYPWYERKVFVMDVSILVSSELSFSNIRNLRPKV